MRLDETCEEEPSSHYLSGENPIFEIEEDCCIKMRPGHECSGPSSGLSAHNHLIVVFYDDGIYLLTPSFVECETRREKIEHKERHADITSTRLAKFRFPKGSSTVIMIRMEFDVAARFEVYAMISLSGANTDPVITNTISTGSVVKGWKIPFRAWHFMFCPKLGRGTTVYRGAAFLAFGDRTVS
eukprot:scaffold6506_cov171-Amphora_coffeaeformis.AAC.1